MSFLHPLAKLSRRVLATTLTCEHETRSLIAVAFSFFSYNSWASGNPTQMTKINIQKFKRFAIKNIFVVLALLFCPLLVAKADFVDVDVTHPYFHAIDALESQGIIQGHRQGDIRYFRPLQEINRAEALKILLLGSGISLQSNPPSRFPDVKRTHWFNSIVHTASDKRIVSGFPNGKFHPETKVTLAEFLKMLVLSFDIYYDPAEDHEKWYSPFISRAKQLNIINDNPDPSKIVTRGEGVEMIFRAQTVRELGYQPYVFSGQGQASYYNEGFAGNLTASGEIYDPFDLTAAHRTLPFNTRIRVYNEEGDSVIVRINDRGPYHKDRIIDLSQRAFERLAPISRGVITVRYEILSDLNTSANRPTVPEHIRPKLSTETRKPNIPDIIQEEINENRVEDFGDPSTGSRPRTKTNKALFSQSVSYISEDFYDGILLRKQVPKRILQGTVFNFSGRVIDGERREMVTVFMQNKANDQQIKFSTPLSGLNFTLPITFFEAGEYFLGVVFDEERKSRVAEITVEDFSRPRKFPSVAEILSSDLEANVVPEEEKVYFSWDVEANNISKLTFSQGAFLVKELVFEDGISRFGIPYDFFSEFSQSENIAIDLYVAKSKNASLYEQTSDWEQLSFKNYLLWPGFMDTEKEAVSIQSFPRFRKNLSPFTLRGTLLDPDIMLRDKAYLTKPNGFVKEITLNQSSIDRFEIRISPEEYGTYIFEVMSDQGEVLFNRAIYVNPELILPVMPWDYIPVTTQSPAAVRHWVNTLRSQQGRQGLGKSLELDSFAQAYAERMGNEDFVGHVDPQGNTFSDRVLEADLTGEEFGENVSFGTTLDLALQGLETSGSHRKNALEIKWKRVGVGAYQNRKGDWYVVQVFAK